MWISSPSVTIVALCLMHSAWALLTNEHAFNHQELSHLHTKNDDEGSHGRITPKVFILGTFEAEGAVWHNIPDFDILALNVTVPGLSPLFPTAHCTLNGTICQLITGEGAINPATTLAFLLHSPAFDLTRTYFLIAGVAGVNPKLATIGSVTFARYAVQVTLQYELDAREKPADFPTGYVPQGALAPDQFPRRLYGTEVFEINDALRQRALEFARRATLNDTADAREYRAHYAGNSLFARGAAPPAVVACDTATSDAFWSGALLAEAFENATRLFTNGSATYCTSQQEDNGTLAALLRGARAGLIDFTRVIIMRTASDFDRPYNGQSAADNLFYGWGGFGAAVENIGRAGVEVVRGIVEGWEGTFEEGVRPTNYVGDIFGSMGGRPDFGPGSVFEGRRSRLARRSMRGRGGADRS